MPNGSVLSFGPSGGAEGDSFSDALPSGAQINGITVFHDNVIYQVAVNYVDGNRAGLLPHGQAKGTQSVLSLKSGEYIVGISGSYDAQIDTLVIQTNQQTSPTYGGNNGTTQGPAFFEFCLPPGSTFMGFTGRATNKQVIALGLLGTSGQTGTASILPCVCMGPGGGSGATPFVDPPIPPYASISSIQVNADAHHICGVQVSYVNNGQAVQLPLHGGKGDLDKSGVLTLSGRIERISGTVDDTAVRSLTFLSDQPGGGRYLC